MHSIISHRTMHGEAEAQFGGYYHRMGMNHMNQGAYEGGQGRKDNPFDENPFIKAKMLGMDGGMLGGETPSFENEESKDEEAKPEKDGDDGKDMESALESRITEKDNEDADDEEDDDRQDMQGIRNRQDTQAGLIPSEPAQSTEDYGYGENLRKQSIRNRIAAAALAIAAIIAVIALIWAIAANPLHLFESRNDDSGGGYSQEYRGSGCRIDGQSCSSDSNGNNPAQ